MSGANIQSSEAIRTFRSNFVKFSASAQQAVDSARSEVSSVADWLIREKSVYWERELRRREDAVERARGEYIRANQEDKYHRKTSSVLEKKALDRAILRKKDAEEKIEAVKKWSRVLQEKSSNLLQPCAALSTTLCALTPQALARLDLMLESLEAYHRASLPAGTVATVAQPASKENSGAEA